MVVIVIVNMVVTVLVIMAMVAVVMAVVVVALVVLMIVRMIVIVGLVRVRMRVGGAHMPLFSTIDLNRECSQWFFRMDDMHAAHDGVLVSLPVAYLQLFLAVARIGNLTRAATDLAITQSTATRWLQSVERSAGDRLFERASGGLRLTTLGSMFMPYAERSVRALEDGLAHLRDVRAGRAGTLRVGCSEVTSTYFLPRVLLQFREEHPTIDLRVRTGSVREIAVALLEGDLEVGFVPSAEDARLESLLLEADAHVFVVAAGDPFAQHQTPRLTDLAERGVILFGIGEPTLPYGLEPFLAAHLTPRVVMEVDSVETAKRMVLEGFGAALLPRMAVEDELASARLVAVALHDADLGHWHVRMVRRQAEHGPGPQATFWDWCARRLPADHPHE